MTPAEITFITRRVRVPESGVVRLPGPYAHDFASMPLYWREIRDVRSKYVDFPALPPGTKLSPFSESERGVVTPAEALAGAPLSPDEEAKLRERLGDVLPDVRFPLRVDHDGVVWQDDGDALDAEGIETLNAMPRLLATLDAARADVERLTAELDTAEAALASCSRMYNARPSHADVERWQRIETAARLKRNAIIWPDTFVIGQPATTTFEGEWVAIPREDFDALRDALGEG